MSKEVPEHVGVSEEGHIVAVHDPGGTDHDINKVYMIVATHENGEGIVGINTPDGWMPLVASEEGVIEKMAQVAIEMAKVAGKKMQLLEFSERRVVRTIWEP